MDSHIYISRSDLLLRKESYIGKERSNTLVAQLGSDRPVALMFRQIATPNFETLWFMRKAHRLGLDPVIIEHVNDKFSVHNAYKRSLLAMPIIVKKNKHKELIWQRHKLAHFDDFEGKKLNSITLQSGESLVRFHHRKLYSTFGSKAPLIVDLSRIVPTVQFGAKVYYRDLLCLLAENAILFEDFVVDKQTETFFSSTVLPAYQFACGQMNGRPQIARLMFGKRAALPVWNSYPLSVLNDLRSEERFAYDAAIAS